MNSHRSEYAKETAEEMASSTIRGVKHIGSSAQDIIEKGQNATTGILESASGYTRGIWGALSEALSNVPPLRYGLYTMLLMSSIPIAIFFGFLGISFTVFASIAVVIVSCLQGGAFILGSTILVPTLFVIGAITLFIFGGFLLAWTFSVGMSKAWDYTSRLFAFSAAEIDQDVKGLERGIKQGMEKELGGYQSYNE